MAITDLLDVAGADPSASRLTGAVRTVWCRVPTDWVADGWLLPSRRAYLLDRLYGTCRSHDRARFIIIDVRAKVLSEREASARPWVADRAGCYIFEPDAEPRAVLPVEL